MISRSEIFVSYYINKDDEDEGGKKRKRQDTNKIFSFRRYNKCVCQWNE